MITSLDRLSSDTRAAARAWLDASGRVIDDPALRADVLDDLESALLAGLDAGASPDDLAGLIQRIGPLDSDSADADADDVDADATDAGPHGTLGGVPFDLRPPTADRVRRTWWNPADPRILVPRVFGLGWALNFGAVAVRLGLIEPDAEDEPFASTPAPAFRAALALPVALTGATVLHYAVRGRSLPERLPNHWDGAGRPDGWTSRRTAALLDLAVTAVPTAFAAWTRSRGRTPQRQAGATAAAAMAATAGASIAVWRTAGDRPLWWAGPALVLAMMGTAGSTLLGLALAGRGAEQRRDLAGAR